MRRSSPKPDGAEAARAEADGDVFVGHPKKKWRRGPTLLIPIVVMAIAVATTGFASTFVTRAAVTATECVATSRMAVVPKTGVLYGVNLDWSQQTLANYAKSVGHKPAVAVQFSDIPYDKKTWERNLQAVAEVKANGGVLLLTLEPNGGLDTVSPHVIRTLVTDLAAINADGVPVIVRFAHEMNGSWYHWGQQPIEYVQKFREVATAIHKGAPGTAMMWAPNYGGGYPFTGGQYAAKPGSADYKALDTNHDGVLTNADDEYAPYYPGNKYVDWVGVSLYHWGNKRPWGDNEITEPNKFLDMLTGTYDGTAGDDSNVPNFYQIYGVQDHHPVAISETAAIYTPSRGGQSELAVKSAWWDQVFSAKTHADFPDLKMINWFEWKKYEIEIKDTVDWRSAGTPAIRKAFDASLPSWLDYADDVKSCN